MTNLVTALHPGAAYLCETLEGERYRSLFDRLVRPEALDDAALDDTAALYIPSRTNPERLAPHIESHNALPQRRRYCRRDGRDLSG